VNATNKKDGTRILQQSEQRSKNELVLQKMDCDEDYGSMYSGSCQINTTDASDTRNLERKSYATPSKHVKNKSILNTGEIQWTEQEIKQSRQFAVKHINLKQNAYENNDKNWKIVGMNGTQQTWNVTKCGPSCQKDHMHRFEYDYTKNYKDHISQRPGIDFVIEPKVK
jgi:hypothetical protein